MSQITLEEIINKIHDEVVSKRSPLFNLASESGISVNLKTESKLWRYLLKINNKLKRYKIYVFLYRFKPLVVNILIKHVKYTHATTIDHLLGLNNRQFIEQCYLTIVGRPVDDEGLNYYLTALRSGEKGKLDIILKLRNSFEGKQNALEALTNTLNQKATQEDLQAVNNQGRFLLLQRDYIADNTLPSPY